MVYFGTTPRRQPRISAPRARLFVEQLEAREVPYGVSGGAWVHPELVTISFVPDGTTLGYDNNGQPIQSTLFADFDARWSRTTWQNAILKGAQAWARQTNINFAIVSDDGSEVGSLGQYQQGAPNYGDIRIGGAHYTQIVGVNFLAQAYMPPQLNNWAIAGDIQFNTDTGFNIGSTYDLFTVAAHEVGHALGMDHSGDSLAVMNAAYPGTKTDLTTDDINGIRHIYSNDAARTKDAAEGALGNNSFSTSTLITINGATKTALVTDLDITTTSDVDYYKFTIPTGTSGTLKVKVQSAGLSLLAPKVYLYDSLFIQRGFANGTGQYGTTLSFNYSPVSALQVYYVKVVGADTSVFGTGKYALVLNAGAGADPTVPLPNTQTANGDPIVTGGGSPEMGSDSFFAGGGEASEGSTDPASLASGANVGSEDGHSTPQFVGIDLPTPQKRQDSETSQSAPVPAQRGSSAFGSNERTEEADGDGLGSLDNLARNLARWRRRQGR